MGRPRGWLRPARNTAIVVRELSSRAERQVIVGGFSFDHGREILEPLHRVMQQRGVEATFFLDIERAPPGQQPDHHAARAVERFFAENWPSAGLGPPPTTTRAMRNLPSESDRTKASLSSPSASRKA